MRKRRLDTAEKKKAEQKADKPLIEKPDVKVTPYPRTGDNPEFEGVLDRVGLEAQNEWVGWPFLLWAQANELDSLTLSTKEALSVAEPVTAILNRHGTGRIIPPDYVDALRAGARLTPILGDRLRWIKKERERRAAAGGGDSHEPTPFVKEQGGNGPVKVQQGAKATKPKVI